MLTPRDWTEVNDAIDVLEAAVRSLKEAQEEEDVEQVTTTYVVLNQTFGLAVIGWQRLIDKRWRESN